MKIGFIGAGNMTNAMLDGISKSHILEAKDIFVSNKSKEKLDNIKNKFNVNICNSNVELIKNADDIIFICVKPQVFDIIFNELKKNINKNQVIVSIMAGKSIESISEALGTESVIRVMPNVPSIVGAGISAVSANETLKNNKCYSEVLNILKSIGEVVEVEEKFLNAITQVSSSSPAFVFMMIEALADGGVNCGLTRDMAYIFATNAVYGAGKLAVEKYRENKVIPASLKDMVASPAGTTIEGIRVLEENGFRGAIIDAVIQAYARSLEL